jgi:hypothetical protein
MTKITILSKIPKDFPDYSFEHNDSSNGITCMVQGIKGEFGDYFSVEIVSADDSDLPLSEKHMQLRQFLGKRIRITVETLD